MKKIAVLTLIATLNLGGAAGELIFQDGFESGWPNAWAQAVGWSAFVVKDSTGALVGPVVGWWSQGDDMWNPLGVPLTATIIDGRKVILKVDQNTLLTGRRIYFEDADCQGQAWICISLCPDQGPIDPNGGPGTLSVYVMDVVYGVGPGNVLYRAEPPAVSPPRNDYESFAYVHPTRDSSIFNCVNDPGSTGFPTYAAEPVVDMDTLFIPPFTVE